MMTGNNSSASDLLDKKLKIFLADKLGWKSLNPIQEKAIPIIKEKKDTLVISPTASGKTEAVLIPIFDDILTNHLEAVSVIYVSPLKALINDMNDRIEIWSDYFNLEVTKWHGDVPGNKKKAFLNKPTDILLITPESLEVIFMNRTFDEKAKIFKNLKYVIIDEIHYFVESDRGTQLNSLLNRITKYVDESITLVGLSATVGNPETVSKWIKPTNPAVIVEDLSNRSFQYKVICGSEIEISKVLSKYINKKILIFVHSRKDAEKYYNILKRTLKIRNIYIHHSSIDRDRREESEEKFKYLRDGFMISTSTLELGIDVGNIDIVVQIRPPHNVSSFLQRIGRSGRRSKNQRSIIFYNSDEEIFISLAEISLIREGNIEDIKIPEKPKDIYFHQILSSIFENGKIKQSKLFNNLKDSYVFSKMTKEDYINILENMEEREFIYNNDGFLSLGYNFEKKFGKRNFMGFYSVFCPNLEYKVKEGGKNIGTLDSFFVVNYLNLGNQFILGGSPWKVLDIDYKRFNVKVQKDAAKKGDVPDWISEGGVIDSLISRRIYEILLGNYEEILLKTFDKLSQNKIKEYVKHAQNVGFKKGLIPVEIDSKENRYYIYTFAGMRANALLTTIFSLEYDLYSPRDTAYYSSFKIKGQTNFENIVKVINKVSEKLESSDINKLIDEKTQKFVKNKFINFLPYEDNVKLKMELLYDVDGLMEIINNNSVTLIGPSKFKHWR
jgi:ATP-dependent Lhr-like helicase